MATKRTNKIANQLYFYWNCCVSRPAVREYLASTTQRAQLVNETVGNFLFWCVCMLCSWYVIWLGWSLSKRPSTVHAAQGFIKSHTGKSGKKEHKAQASGEASNIIRTA
eukprot:3908913-Amphidinium_carterae.2